MNDLTPELICLRWWQKMFLSPEQLKEKGLQAAPRLYKAQLKRCHSIHAIMLTAGFRDLWLSLPHNKASNIECWAILAGALVYVKQNIQQNIAQAAGSKGKNDKSVVSELRFARLQEAKTADDFLRYLRRTLQQVNSEVAVMALIKDVQQWFFEQRSLRPQRADKRISVRWAMEYYSAAAK